jgi:hypothetical protein
VRLAVKSAAGERRAGYSVGVKIPVAVFEIRNPQNHGEVYATSIEDEAAAFARAHEVADFYQHPVEVRRVLAGRFGRRIGEPIEPSPLT